VYVVGVRMTERPTHSLGSSSRVIPSGLPVKRKKQVLKSCLFLVRSARSVGGLRCQRSEFI